LPNPSGEEKTGEWVDVFNPGDSSLDLAGFILEDAASHQLVIGLDYSQSGTIIEPKRWLVIERNNHPTFSLNNSGGDTVRLLNEQGDSFDEFTYESDPGEDKSLGRSPDGSDNWLVFEDPTKGSANSQPTPTVSPTPSLVPTNSPTPLVEAKKEEQATCLVKSPTDSSGNTLTSVKIYVDGVYIHHYAPEELIFGSGRFCDQESKVVCDFGQHKITLEKSGFESESIEQEFYSGTQAEINLVLKEVAPTSKPASISTPTLKPTVALVTTSANLISTGSGEVLGEVDASESAFYPLGGKEASSSSLAGEINGGRQKPFWPWLILGTGVVFLFSSAFLVYRELTP